MGTITLCARCEHPTNSHYEGRCNVVGDGFPVCDCGQPVIEEGEEVLGYIGFSSFRDDVA